MRNYFLLSVLDQMSALGKQKYLYTIFLTSTKKHAVKLVFIHLLLAVSLSAFAQDFAPDRVVFPITDFKPDLKLLAPIALKFGTGFCLDPECRFVGTNYHVAKVMGKYVRIKGVFSEQRYLDSDPNDAGAQAVNLNFGGSLTYTPAHDLAIYEMRRPLKHFHGIGFNTDDLRDGFDADIYAYPFNWNLRRKLVCWHGKFMGKTLLGLLAFKYEEGRVHGGASGGIVVDSKTKKIVGILNGVGDNNERIALAVPVKELEDFVIRAQPYLQATLFPKTVFVSPVAKDLYTPYVWPRSELFSQRPQETPETVELRRKAEHLADSMHNFTATETFAWGHDNREPDATDAYETLIVDGAQRWHHRGSKKFYDENVPIPALEYSITPGAEWSYLPEMVGTKLRLKIHQAPDAVVGGRTIHVFQYVARAEDGVCRLRQATAYGLFGSGKTSSYDCHGEVWLDESGTILRISETMDLSGQAYRWWGVMTYGWLEKDGKQYRVPVTIVEELDRDKTYWCRGMFTDYEMFGAKTRLLLSAAQEQPQEPARGKRDTGGQ